MNISEMHVWFRQYAQQMGMQNTRAILPEQIDLLINTSINDVVNKIIAENISNRNDRVISDNSKIGQINALRTLYTTQAIKGDGSTLDNYKVKPFTIALKDIKDLLYIDDFAISYYTDSEKTKETSLFPVRLIDRALLADTLQDYILAPRFRTPIAAVTNRVVNTDEETSEVVDFYFGQNELHSELIKVMTIKEIECSIIRKPAKVKYVSDINGQNVNCDLPESLHYDVLKHAVDLYRLSISGSIAAAQEQAQNQARENIRNNIREE